MMDVLEHLPDPAATLPHCLNLLKTDGILVIQIPPYRKARAMRNWSSRIDPFLEQLKPDEHLYLFSPFPGRVLRRLGAAHVAFEPAIFAHYDMCFVVSRSPLRTNSQDEIESSLMTAKGRIALALLDMKERSITLPSSRRRLRLPTRS